MCAFYLSDVSRGREPNHRLAFGKRLRFLALCSVFILADTLCRFAIYLKTALCRAAPLTSHFVRQRSFDIANESVSRGREPNRRLAFGKRLRFLALCSVSILADTLCRFAIYLKTALCRAAPLTSRPSTTIRYCERVRFKGQRTQPQVGVRRLLANACVMQRVYLSSHFVSLSS